jgi:hypothetical protein
MTSFLSFLFFCSQTQAATAAAPLKMKAPPSSDADNIRALDHTVFDEDRESRRSGYVQRPTRDVAPQMSQDAKLAEAKHQAKYQEEKKGEGNERVTTDRRV